MTKALSTTTVSFATLARDGGLLADMLRARKRVFIDRKEWNLQTLFDMEFDQYDTPLSRWVVSQIDGKVLAGDRLTPTTAQMGGFTYMLKDAQDGRLEGLPADVLDWPAPVDDHTWEGSRIFVAIDCPAPLRSAARDAMLMEMIRHAMANGVRQLICILPRVWPELARRHHLAMKAIGPVFGGRDRCQAVSLMLQESLDLVASFAGRGEDALVDRQGAIAIPG